MSSWQEKRQKQEMRVSASQLDVYRLCARKWWLDKVRKLPTPQTSSFTFGTVLAEVCERYIKADDLGYDADGQPVNLYPEGWTKATNRFTGELDGEVNPAEADIIQRLVAKAIEEGVLERKPRRSAEHEFEVSVVDLVCPTCQGSGWVYDESDTLMQCPSCQGTGQGTRIVLTGAMDVFYPGAVEDHKSTKSMRWAKSPRALRENTQMLVYAKIALEEARKQGMPIPESVTLRHNVFCKDPNDLRVKKVETSASRKEIEAHWNRVIQDVSDMEFWRRNANLWHDLPDPPTGARACNAYGGCPFRTICSGRESEEGYALRLDRYLSAGDNASVHLTVSAPNGGSTMSQQSFAANLAQANGGQAPVPPQPQQQQQAPPVNPPMPMGPSPVPPSGPPQAPQPQQQQAPQPQQQQQAPQPQQQQAPQPQQQQAPQPQQQQAPQPQQQQEYQLPETAAPWADPECVACGGWGFDSRGNPCPICTEKARQKGIPGPDMFNLEYRDGKCWWTHKQHPEYRGVTPLQSSGEVQSSEKVEVRPQESQQGVTADTTQDKGVKPSKDEKGRPKKSFELFINVMVHRGATTRGDRKVYDLSQMLDNVGQQIAQQFGANSYWDIDPQQRRDVLMKSAEAIAEEIGTARAVAVGIGYQETDLKVLVDALMPLAGFVCYGWTPNG